MRPKNRSTAKPAREPRPPARPAPSPAGHRRAARDRPRPHRRRLRRVHHHHRLRRRPQVAAASQSSVDEGKKLFQANCATCHGLDAAGHASTPRASSASAPPPSTSRSAPAACPCRCRARRRRRSRSQFTDEQVKALADYVASLAPGPSIPEQKYLDGKGDAANGAELFRINCAMCHNVAGAGGALTEGKYAPPLDRRQRRAHLRGHGHRPAEHAGLQRPEHHARRTSADIITYLKYIQNNPSPGGFELGSLGPVAEGLFLWIFGLGAIVALTVWITAKSN